MDGQAVALDLDLLFPGGKGPNEAELFYVLGDVDEATRPNDTVVEAMGIHVPPAVHLRKAQHGHIQCTTIVER